MRLTSIIFFLRYSLLLWMLCSCRNDQAAESNVMLHLFALERKAISREFENDTAYLSSIMDSTFIEISQEKIKNKHQVLRTIYADNIARVQKGIIRDSFLLKDSIIHVYGNTAVITFIMQTFNKKGDSSFTRRTRFYDVWVKRNHEWKAISWQGTPIE